jgi:hypothetical protein
MTYVMFSHPKFPNESSSTFIYQDNKLVLDYLKGEIVEGKKRIKLELSLLLDHSSTQAESI